MAIDLPSNLKFVAGLWPKESARGNVYFVGGNRTEKLHMFFDPDAGDTDPPWNLYAEARTPKPAASGGRTATVAGFRGSQAPAPPKRRQRRLKAVAKTPPPEIADDALEDLFKGEKT